MFNMPRREFFTSAGAAAFGVSAHLGNSHAWGATGRKKIKIGQIGTGHAHAAGKMRTLQKFQDDYEVVGVVEPDPKQRKTAANSAAYRGVQWMTEEQLLDTAGLQAVAVETRVCDLVPTAGRCVAAGLHVHLDKPAGESLSAFKAVLDEAARKNLTVQMGYMFRYNPAFQFCFQAVREGWLGDIFEVHAVISKAIPADRRKQLAQYAGGSIFELGCHLIDAVSAVLGKPDKVTPFVRHTRSQQDDLADNCLAVLEYPTATATVRSALVEVEGQRRRQFVVCGDEGTVDIRPLEPPQLQLALSRPHGKFKKGYQSVDLPPLSGRYDGDFIDLAKIIRGEKQCDYAPAHDLAVHETILRASGMPLN